MAIEVPGLNKFTDELIEQFALALKMKMLDAQQKYGRELDWKNPDWMDECRQQMMEHIAKGDPLDVAAYCSFLWYHGEKTNGK